MNHSQIANTQLLLNSCGVVLCQFRYISTNISGNYFPCNWLRLAIKKICMKSGREKLSCNRNFSKVVLTCWLPCQHEAAPGPVGPPVNCLILQLLQHLVLFVQRHGKRYQLLLWVMQITEVGDSERQTLVLICSHGSWFCSSHFLQPAFFL